MSMNRPGSNQWSYGRSFASMDPERQGEAASVRTGSIETTPAQRFASPRPARLDWTRVQPDRESSNFEGSSSRRGL